MGLLIYIHMRGMGLGHGPRAWLTYIYITYRHIRGMGLGHGPRAWLTYIYIKNFNI